MKTLIFADVHANLAALDAVLAHESTWDEIFFLGDAIMAGPRPEEVVQRLSSLENGVWILGNHDLEPFERTFDDGDINPDQMYEKWTRNQLTDDSRQFLESFETTRVVERQGLVMRLYHGHFPEPVGRMDLPDPDHKVLELFVRAYRRFFHPEWENRIWPDTDPRVFAAISDAFPEPYVLIAHSHVQFRKQIGETVFVNPGSVGQPRLGQALASYAVLEDGTIDLRAVPYDTEATCRALDRVPLPSDFIQTWKAGYRAGRLPDRYPIRDWEPLIREGYR